MKQTLAQSQLENVFARLENPQTAIRIAQSREPVHVVYGGAHLFKADTAQKLGKIALKSLHEYAPNAAAFAEIFGQAVRTESGSDRTSLDVHPVVTASGSDVYERVLHKLETEAVEDLRIDFEDGYGFRTDDEEDRHAIEASSELAKAFHQNTVSPFCGFRIKSFQRETAKRAVRTLDLFLTNLLEKTDGKLPNNFVVTLPKVERAAQVAVLAELLGEFERQNNLSANVLKLEILIETPTAIVNERGEINLRRLVEAADGRCVAAHFGAYDFTSSMGIAAEKDLLHHQICDFARNWMQVALQPMGVRLSDSVTTLMPVPIFKGDNLSDEQKEQNRQAVTTAWRAHFQNVSRSLENGFYSSWDLHPAQLVARYAAVYSFFFNSLDSSAKRLRGFVEKSTQAMLTGNQFDDLASANVLLGFFNRALNCGALTETEVLERTNLSLEELRSGSFATILEQRKLK